MCNWVFIAESGLYSQWISMNLKGLSRGGREIKLDFYNQKAIKTCRILAKPTPRLEDCVGCTVAKHFQWILQFVKILLALKIDEVLVLVDFHAPAFLEFWFICSQRSGRTKNIGWEGFVACEGNQVKVGGREAKHRAKEDEDLGLYL